MRDEQDAILRLADSMAGFLRDHIEGQKYTNKFMTIFQEKQIILEI